MGRCEYCHERQLELIKNWWENRDMAGSCCENEITNTVWDNLFFSIIIVRIETFFVSIYKTVRSCSVKACQTVPEKCCYCLLTCFMFLFWPTILLAFHGLSYYFSIVLWAASTSVYTARCMRGASAFAFKFLQINRYVKWSGTWNMFLFLVRWQII